MLKDGGGTGTPAASSDGYVCGHGMPGVAAAADDAAKLSVLIAAGESLSGAAGGILPQHVVSKWTVQDVCAWAAHAGMSLVDIGVLRSEQISGRVLWVMAASLSNCNHELESLPSSHRSWMVPLFTKLSLGAHPLIMSAIMNIVT
jgi:hypothetical protein